MSRMCLWLTHFEIRATCPRGQWLNYSVLQLPHIPRFITVHYSLCQPHTLCVYECGSTANYCKIVTIFQMWILDVDLYSFLTGRYILWTSIFNIITKGLNNSNLHKCQFCLSSSPNILLNLVCDISVNLVPGDVTLYWNIGAPIPALPVIDIITGPLDTMDAILDDFWYVLRNETVSMVTLCDNKCGEISTKQLQSAVFVFVKNMVGKKLLLHFCAIDPYIL